MIMDKEEKKPKLYLTCGYVASGKTTVSNRLAAIAGAEVIRTDDIRKELFPLSIDYERIDIESENSHEEIMKWIESNNEGLIDFQQVINPLIGLSDQNMFSEIIEEYGSKIDQQKEKAYDEAFSRCSASLSEGIDVIFDATFSSKEQRERAYETAKSAGLDDAYLIQVMCDEEIVASRLEARKGKSLTSNAKQLEVYRIVKKAFDESRIELDDPDGLGLHRIVYHTDEQKYELHGTEDSIVKRIASEVIDPLVSEYAVNKKR